MIEKYNPVLIPKDSILDLFRAVNILSEIIGKCELTTELVDRFDYVGKLVKDATLLYTEFQNNLNEE
jgi:hypothetical protein